MILKKLINGVHAAQYLPYALSRMRVLNALHGDNVHFTEKKTFDGCTIEVQQTPPIQYVRLTDEGAFDFEFTTSGNPMVTGTIVQLGVSFNTYKAATVVCKVAVEGGTLRAAPSITNGTRVFDGGNSTIKRPFQVELTNEPVAYPRQVGTGVRKRFPFGLFESWAPNHPHTGVHLRNTSWGFDGPRFAAYDPSGIGTDWKNYWVTELDRVRQRGALGPHLVRDLYYDIPYQENTGTAPVRTAYIRDTPADWPRAMGNQKVVDLTWGTREFAIYVDAFNQFFVFPTSQIDPIDPLNPFDQNVLSTFVKNPTVTLPAGTYAPSMRLADYFPGGTLTEGLVDFPELDWKFNHLGTRAVTIAYSRAPFAFDSADLTSNVGTVPFTLTEFNELRDQLGVQGRQGLSEFAPGHNPDRYFVGPGIIEASIVITLTGPNPEDFTTSVTVDVIRDPAASDYCPLAVGYAWYDLPTKATAGDMIVFDVEQWAEAGVRSLPVSLLSVKNLTTVAELLVSAVPLSIMAIDFPTLSFAARVDNQVVEFRDNTGIGGAASSRWETLHFGVVLIHKLAVKDTLYPATMSVPNKDAIASMIVDFGDGATYRAGRYLVPLQEARDWTDTAMANARAYILGPSIHGSHQHATGPASTPAIQDTLTQWYWEWDTFMPVTYLVFCDAPKFGWHLYADLLCRYLNVNAATTYYVHPNGTYCFWDSAQIYNPMGAGADVDIYDMEQLAGWDPALLEHVIFDYVRLQVGNAGNTTTFQSLYNKAVVAGTAAGTLVDTFTAITDASLRATFTKSDEALVGARNYLRMHASWNGHTYYCDDPGVQGGGSAGGPFVVAPINVSIETNFNQAWIDDATSVATLPTEDHKHIRFANPIVLMDAAAA